MDRTPSPDSHGFPGSQALLDRRRFLVLVGATAAYAALRPHAAWARKAAVGPVALQPWSLPEEPPVHSIDTARALIGAAVLAPSNWNSQPWSFEVEGTSIRVVADTRRSLPIGDPDRRHQMMSLGAALENLLVAARAYGLRPQVEYLPHGGAGEVVATVSWTNGDVRRDRSLFAAIPERRTNRREYDGRGIFPQNRVQLLAQATEAHRLHWIDDREAIEEVAEIAREAVEARVADRPTQAEAYSWMRFDDSARRRGDGVTPEALGLGGPARWMSKRYFHPQSWFFKFGPESAGKQARSAIRSAGAMVLLTTQRGGEPAWLLGGQTYERFALKATELGIAHQPINAPIQSERHRSAILGRFGAAGEEPLMLVRLGHASPPEATVRRSVALVASFRNS